jgi:hypothetical protein
MTVSPPSFTPTWLAPADVLSWLRTNLGVEPAGEVDGICVATEIHVQDSRPDLWDTTDPEALVYAPDAQVYRAAVMYAARLLRRRNNPSGVESFGDMGPTFPTKYDTDIDRALRTGSYQRPGVG